MNHDNNYNNNQQQKQQSPFHPNNNSNNNSNNYSRPRRPSPDTITYLRFLPIMLDVDIQTALSELQTFQDKLRDRNCNDNNNDQKKGSTHTNEYDEDDDLEFPSSIAAAIQAIYEIRNEIASLACDEYGATCIETLCTITIPISSTICRMVLHAICNNNNNNSDHNNNYSIHLATHRYGSHVLQTILQLSTIHCSSTPTTISNNNSNNNNHSDDLALHIDAPMIPNMDTVPTNVMDIILQIASSLHTVVHDLMIHICGSHCIRTILCILGGVDFITTPNSAAVAASSSLLSLNDSNEHHRTMMMVQQRRGKVKPKKKKRKKAASDEQQERDTSRNPLNEPRMIYPTQHHRKSPTDTMIQLLHQYTSSITLASNVINDNNDNNNNNSNAIEPSVGPGQLQSWVCHTSAGPVITVLLQVWVYYEYAVTTRHDTSSGTNTIIGNKHPSEILLEQQVLWEKQQTTPDKHICYSRPEPHYKIGSMAHKIVQRILCWRNDMEQKTFGSDVLYGLAGEARGSHCLETILRVSPDTVYEQILNISNIMDPITIKEYIYDTVSNFVLQTILQTIRNIDQAKQIFQSIEPHISYILDPINKRRWILWRMVELAAKLENVDCQNTILSMISDGFTLIQQQQQQQEGNSNTTTKLTSDTNRVKINKGISKLIQVVPPVQYGDRVGVDIAGTRIVHHLLRFLPDLCKDTLKGITELSPNDIELLIKDPFASRCIFDEIIQNKDTSNVGSPIFSNARKRLLSKMQGRWISAATDRVGHHTVLKLFTTLDDINDKKSLAEELIVGRNRMNSNSMGRTVFEKLELYTYEMKGEQVWIDSVKRQATKKEWLNDIIGECKTSFKRAELDTDSKDVTTKKKRVSNTVDAIIDAISIPP